MTDMIDKPKQYEDELVLNASEDEKRLAAKKKKLDNVMKGNELTFVQIRAKRPDFGMDTSNARRELFMDFLEDLGIITTEQRIDFEILFHEKVEEALAEFAQELKKQEAMRGFVVPGGGQPKPRLTDRFGNPL